MLKSMRDASAQVGESDSNEMGMYQDMFDKQIALSLSQGHGSWIGSAIDPAVVGGGRRECYRDDAGRPQHRGPRRPGTDRPRACRRLPPRWIPTRNPPGWRRPRRRPVPNEFVSQVFPSIQRAAQALGVSPFAMLAQAALETGWGKRMARNADGTSSLNLFGIKADDSWSGAKVAADTLEFSGGVATQRRTAFRAYGSVEESVDDFARLLASSPRYRDALARGGNAQAYFEGIGRSGYATDPQYADKLNGVLNSATFRSVMGKRIVSL